MPKQLYETYKKEDDVFYTDVADYTQMSEKELEEYESIYLDLPKELMTDNEMLLRRAFHTKWLTHGKVISSAYTVRLLLLCVPYITSEALCRLHIFANDKSAGRFLSANLQSPKNKNGYLRAFAIQGGRIRKGYTLTASARQELLSQLPDAYIQTKLATSKKACTGSNMHDALCCNMYYYLLSDYTFPYFEWYNAPYFDSVKSFKENVDAMTRIPTAGTSGFRPDAFITTLTQNKHYFFIEQDMGTESTTRLAEKFTNYANMFDTQSVEETRETTIIVSVYVESGYDGFGKNSADVFQEKGTTTARLKRNCDNLLFYISAVTEEHADVVTVSELKTKLLTTIDTITGKHSQMLENHYRDIYLLLDEFIANHPNAESIEDLEKYLDDLITEKNIKKQRQEQIKAGMLLSSRKKTLRNVVESIPELQLHLQNGLRMPIIETGHPEELNKVLLTHHINDVLEKQLLPCVSEKLGLQGKYTIMQAINFGAGIHFCNHCTYEMAPEKYLVFENISADISAWYRLKNFISRVDSMPKDEMYIFILASSMEDIIEFNSDIYEKETVAERYTDPKNAIKPKSNICFAYFCYGEDTEMQKPFLLDREGKTVFL